MPKVIITPRSYGLHSPSVWKTWEDRGFECICEPGPLSEEKLSRLLSDADALIVGTDKVTERVLEQAPSLRIVSKYGVGVDNIAVDFALSRGIEVTNTPGVNTEAVADYTFALILSLARRVPQSHIDVVQGQWKKSVGFEIWGKTIGILGLGSIGKGVVRRAKGFNMKILAYDLYPDNSFATEQNVEFVDLETVLRSSDILSLHLALTPQTYHLIGRKELSLMKQDAMLINTARGGIVDEDALFQALHNRQIGGAALDVFQNEPPEDTPLRKLDNVILTSHNAAASVEAIIRMTEQSTENVIEFFEKSL